MFASKNKLVVQIWIQVSHVESGVNYGASLDETGREISRMDFPFSSQLTFV